MRASVFSAKGVKTESKLELPDKIFGIKPSDSALRQYVHVYEKTQRAGTVATKTRGQVSGGGRKPWAQKGTGRARHGSVRSPIWVGGGVTFGPQPRTFKAALPKKVKDLALRSALSAKAAAGQVYVVADPVFKAPSTSQARELLAKLKVTRPLVVLSARDNSVRRSFRNLPGAETIEVRDLNPYAVLKAREVVFFKEGLGKLKEKLAKEKPVKPAPAAKRALSKTAAKKTSKPKVKKIARKVTRNERSKKRPRISKETK